MILSRTLTALSFVFAFSAVTVVSAQQQNDPQQTPAPIVHAHHHHTPQQETAKLTRKLGLTSEQAAQVEPILAAKQEQMQALRASGPSDPQAMHQQMRAISHDSRAKLNAVLTDAQRLQLKSMRAHHHHRQQEQQASTAPVI